MIVGITATREGLTAQQAERLAGLLVGWDVERLDHGDCVGGDAAADAVAAALGIPRHAHPPDNPGLRAFCQTETAAAPRPYKERNAEIVRLCAVLVALPRTAQEEHYGGTWSTIRFARSVGRPLLIVAPNGTIYPERWPVGLGLPVPGE